MTEERTRIDALKQRLETGKAAKKATQTRLTVYLTPETRERIEELYAEVYHQTRARKIAFLEEVIKAGLEEKDRVISALQKGSKHNV
ncbi:unnamed protein product [marine sediment metagenome]|uniref:Uncharacterized protein n=1 Tax=marine sediment metagenome TaxID=412755 RepID=X1U9G3_9ZZZZ